MKLHDFKLAMAGILVLFLSGCSNEETFLDIDPDTNPDGVYATLSVSAKSIGSFAPQSRDSWEPSKENAVCHEGEIQDVIVFIYSTSLNLLSAESTEKPLQIEYLPVTEESTVNGEKVYTIPKFKLSESLTAGTYNVFIIANPDYRTAGEGGPNCNKADFADKTLLQIRDYAYEGALYRDIAGEGIPTYDRFIMSSDEERSFTITDDDITNHATVSLSKKTDGTETPIVVERLAARIDVSFGKSIVYNNDGTVNTYGAEYRDASGTMLTLNADGSFSSPEASEASVASIKLPVYDYNSYKTDKSLVPTYDTYVITDIDVLNVVNNKQMMIQVQNNVYFQDERWAHKDGDQIIGGTTVAYDGTYSQNTTKQAAGCTKSDEDHTLADLLVKRNNLYTNTGIPYYTLGYFRENTATGSTASIADIKAGKTTVKITGQYLRASDLNSSSKTYDHNLEFTIMHCRLDAGTPYPCLTGAMAYAIGRNTIYRLCIDKMFTDGEKVYVIWYYDSDNDGTYNSYATSTGFDPYIIDKNTTPVD